MGRHRLALSVAGLVLLSAAGARAATPTDTLRDFFTRANVVIQAPEEQMTVEERIVLIRQMANAVFDVRRAAADALGDAWQTRTPAEQEQFAHLFGDALQRAYLALVGLKAKVSGGVGVAFVDEAVTGDAAVVRTTLATRTNGALSVEYRMARAGSQWAVVDAMVDGVSLVGNYRSQFSRVLQSYTYADLVDMMQAVAPDSPRPVVAMASDAVKPGDDVRVMPVLQAAQGASSPTTPPVPGAPSGTAPPEPATPSPTDNTPIAPIPAIATARVADTPATDDTPAVGEGTTMPEAAPSAAVGKPSAAPPGPTPPATNTVVAGAMAAEVPYRAGAANTKQFWVDIGAFDSPELAAKALARLSDPAVAIFTPPSGGRASSRTRVLVGPFAERGAAAAKARELEAAGYRGLVAEE